MGNIFYGVPMEIESIDFSWMVGCTIENVTFHEPTMWVFSFTKGGSISTESLWRIIKSGTFAACGKDHGHQFGLPAPVDSATQAISVLSKSIVTGVEIRKDTLDLIMQFDNELQLEIISESRGYDVSNLRDPYGNWFVAGRGRICIMKEKM
jgi:hypothetical protein